MSSIQNLRIAVLVDTPPDNLNFWLDTRQSWKKALSLAAPTATVDLYDPVVERRFPNAPDYDLIVLTGGKADASSDEPWVLGLLDYVRTTAYKYPRTKMLGICWGHQAVSRALGGEVKAVSSGPIVSTIDNLV